MEANRLAPEVDYWPDTVPTEAFRPAHRSAVALHEVSNDPLSTESLVSTAARGAYVRRWKRSVDLLIGVPLFLVAVPVIALAVLAVAVTTGWPAFYKTKRVGVRGREFTMWKIRSMVNDAERVLRDWRVSSPELAAEYDANFKLRNDPRITRLGRFLRRTSIDELPQLWNVLRGDMSLVGPRPYYHHELVTYPATFEAITRVRPGVTGPWQVAGRNDLTPAERMFIDRTYVNTCRATTDLRLLLSTVRTLLKPNGI